MPRTARPALRTRLVTVAIAAALTTPLLAAPTQAAPVAPSVSMPMATTTVSRYVSVNVANVRSGPSTSYRVVGTYSRGTKLTGTLTSSGWLKVGTARYIAPSVLTKTAPTVTRYVTVKTANVRQSPASTATVVGVKNYATKLSGTKTSTGWLKIGDSRFVSPYVLSTSSPTQDSGTLSGSAIIAESQKYVGIMYVYGGNTPSGFDCSGFTQYVFGRLGVPLPRSAAAQQDYATRVTSPRVGDLVFWGNPAYHVGIYAGDGYVYDSGKPGLPVQKRRMFSGVSTYGRVTG